MRCGGRGQTPRPGWWDQNIHLSVVHCSLRPHLSSTSSSNLPFEPVEVCETSPLAPHASQLGLRSTTRRARRLVQLQQDNSPRSTPHASRIGAGPATRRGRGPNFFFYQPLLGAGASPNTRRTRRNWGCASHQSSTTPTRGHAIPFFFLTVQPSQFPAPVLTPCASKWTGRPYHPPITSTDRGAALTTALARRESSWAVKPPITSQTAQQKFGRPLSHLSPPNTPILVVHVETDAFP